MLRATTACIFSTSQPPKVLRTWCFVHFDSKRRAFFHVFSTSQLPKVVRDRQFFTLLTWKCASRHNGVHFFDILTFKSGLRMVCFVLFDLEICFAPGVHFSTCQLPKWSEREASSPALLRNVLHGAQLFISHLTRWLRTGRFSEPTFRPDRATNHWNFSSGPYCRKFDF